MSKQINDLDEKSWEEIHAEERLKMSDQPILYLMSKYSGREAESLKENQDAWLQLVQKGYDVYSPICESHNIEEYRKSTRSFSVTNPQYIVKYPEYDYVARDLRLIQRLSNKDGGKCVINYIHCQYVDPMKNCEICESYQKYDSGIVGVVCPSAYHRCSNPAECCDPPNCVDCQEFVWQSKGAKAEYDWMKDHHILVITLETALTVPPDRWREYSL